MRITLLILLLLANISQASPPSGTLYPIIWKWLIGKADSTYLFTNNSHPKMVQNLQNAYQIKRAREFWYNKNLDSFRNGQQNWLGVTNFLGRFQTIRGIYRSGFDMVEQTLGTYIVNIIPVGKDSIKFKVIDIKSRWSVFLHCPLVNNRAFDSNRKRQKLMTDVKWIFEWTEAIQAPLFYRRELNIQLYKQRKYSGKGY